MYEADLIYLRCPKSGAPLHVESVSNRAPDGELIDGQLIAGEHKYQVRGGIPRFVDDVSYNKSWDFKWRELDGGKALNYRIIDKSDPAYEVHDIFDRNGHDGLAWLQAKGGVALDVGCGIGQYAVKLCLEQSPRKVIAMDLTGGVDIFRAVLHERYPHLKEKILIVQASVFELPFPDATFDFIMSLGVLMHTGDTRRAVNDVCKKVKDGGEVNFWIYGSEALAYEAVEPNREGALTVSNVKPFIKKWDQVAFWLRLFRKMKHDHVVRFLRFMSSERIYQLSKQKRFRWIESVFPTVRHPDEGYRLINNYDGYVNNWQDTWAEQELFPILKQNDIAVLGFGSWRVGLWGRKIRGFYPRPSGPEGRE